MVLHWTPVHRFGQTVGHIRSSMANVNRALHVGTKVWHAVKDSIPDSKMKQAASKGVTSYESVIEKIRAGAL